MMDLVTDASTSIRDNLLEMLTSDWITVPVEKLLDVISQMEQVADKPDAAHYIPELMPDDMREPLLHTWEAGYRCAMRDLVLKLWPEMAP